MAGTVTTHLPPLTKREIGELRREELERHKRYSGKNLFGSNGVSAVIGLRNALNERVSGTWPLDQALGYKTAFTGKELATEGIIIGTSN